jgi:quinoprotein glucose dehydrogenase
MRFDLVAMGCLLAFAGHAAGQSPQNGDWPGVGNDPGCMRYSKLDQINRENVTRLKPVWTYHTRELEGRTGKTIECTPIVIDGVMYVTTGYLRVVALDAATGKELWQFDPLKDHPFAHQTASGGVNRGCAYWSDGKPGGERRIIHGTSDGRLFALDAKNGSLDPKFGDGGICNLRKELDPNVAALDYGPTSAPAVWKNTIIVGVSCGEGPGIAAPGDIRAFDVRTGLQVWRFRTVPGPGEFGNETWHGDSWKDRGGANAWGGLSVDTDRGLVFAGLGSAAFDFFGGDRRGDNLFANCTIALDANTGKRVWHFQTLRHDLWDHDLPVYPNLVTVKRDGKTIDAAAQVTKTGYVFLFDRATGKPLFEIRDQPVPLSEIPGESASATQPVPVLPPPFASQSLDESNVTDIGSANREFVLERLRKIRGGPAFNPPSRQGTVVIPGFHGGATWSGAAFDPTTGFLYVNSNNVPNILTLVETKDSQKGRHGPFSTTGYEQFLDHEGYPAIKPPWGILSAIDLNTGKFAWQVPLGEHPELTARGVPRTGTENFGGSIVTAGGLVFIAGTKDERIHAFDKETGRLLWEQPLPAGGYATPSTYQVNGRQYVVIAAGGAGKPRTKAGDTFVAFGLEPAANSPAAGASDEPAKPEKLDKKPSFAIEPAALAYVGKFDRMALFKDETFVRALKDLAASDLSPAAKADAFALMLERIGWLFVGAARLFPGRGYAETQAMIVTTLVEYEQKMPKGLEVRPLLELARTARNDHPLRSSNALLLATILNREAAKDAVRKAIDLKAIEAAQVPAIDLHNLSLAAALTADPKLVGELVALLPKIHSEESREDLIAITLNYRTDELRGQIEQFVRTQFPALFDNSVQTALIVLAHVGPPNHFRDFYKSLGDLNKDKKDIDLLRKFWDRGFRDRLQPDEQALSPLKIWDGFTLTLDNKGGWVTFGKSFRCWISFE